MNDEKLKYYSKMISKDLISKVDPESAATKTAKKTSSGRFSGGMLSAALTVVLFAVGTIFALMLSARFGSRNKTQEDPGESVAGATEIEFTEAGSTEIRPTEAVSPGDATPAPEKNDMDGFESAKKIRLTLPDGIIPKNLDRISGLDIRTNLLTAFGLGDFEEEVEISEDGRFRLFINTMIEHIYQPAIMSSILEMPVRICVTGRIETVCSSDYNTASGESFAGINVGDVYSLVWDDIIFRYEDQENNDVDMLTSINLLVTEGVFSYKSYTDERLASENGQTIDKDTLEEYVNSMIKKGIVYSTFKINEVSRMDIRMITESDFLVECLSKSDKSTIQAYTYGEDARPVTVSFGAARIYKFDENGLLNEAEYIERTSTSVVKCRIDFIDIAESKEMLRVTLEGSQRFRCVILNEYGKEIYEEKVENGSTLYAYTAYTPYGISDDPEITQMISQLLIYPERITAYEFRYLANDNGVRIKTMFGNSEVDIEDWGSDVLEGYCSGIVFDASNGGWQRNS